MQPGWPNKPEQAELVIVTTQGVSNAEEDGSPTGPTEKIVGWLVKETDKYVTVAPRYNYLGPNWNRCMTAPKATSTIERVNG